jgi:hypothetical protein
MERVRGQGPPFIEDRGKIFYDEEEVEAYIEANRRNPDGSPVKRTRRGSR